MLATGVVCSTGEREELADSGSLDALWRALCEALFPGDFAGISVPLLVTFTLILERDWL